MAQHVANSLDKYQSLPCGLQSVGDLTHSAASGMAIHCIRGAFPRWHHSWVWAQLTTCLPTSREIKLSLSSFKLSHSQARAKAGGCENSRHSFNEPNEICCSEKAPNTSASSARKVTSKSCLEHWSRCAKAHHERNVSMQAPDEPFAKFPGTCKSQTPAHTKSSCGFGALNPCGAAPLAHPPSQKDFSKHLPSASSEQIREHAAQPSPLLLHTNPPHDLVSPRPSVTAKHPQSPQLTAGRETPNQGRRAFARGGEDGWGGGEERREGNNLHSQGKKLKLGQILH